MSVFRPATFRTFNINFFHDLPWLMLLFLMLLVPTTYKYLKAGILSLCLTQCIFMIALEKNRSLKIHPSVINWLILMLANGLFFVLRGGFNDAPGALRVLTVVALWPMVFVFLSQLLVGREVLEKSVKVCTYVTIAIALYAIYFLLYEAGIIPQSLYVAIDMGQASSIERNWVEFTLNSLASLLFLVPFLIAGIFVWKDYFSKKFLRIAWFGVILGTFCVLLSGRRALQLVTGLAPFIFLLFWFLLPKWERRKSAPALIKISLIACCSTIVFMLFLFATDFSVVEILISRFSDGFRFTADSSAIARMRQFLDLTRGWMEAPFFGHGWGSVAKGLIRDPEMPWAYELFYSAALFQLGLVGFLIYAAGIGWIYVTGCRIIRQGALHGAIMLPLLTGMTCFLIANSTNPYLGKFDCMWVIFLPVACINSWLLQKRVLVK